jgi:hypothetical protein
VSFTPNRGVRLCLVAVVGYLFGFATAHIPAPHEAGIFWLGNLAAPYLLIAFLAGAWRFRSVLASVAGALGAVAGIAGFYGFLGVGDVTNAAMGLSPDVTARAAVMHAYGRWSAS